MIENEGKTIPPREPELLKVKPVSHSKTIWFNIGVGVCSLLAEQSGLMQSMLSDKYYLAFMIIISSINIYLRSITDTAVSLNNQKDAN